MSSEMGDGSVTVEESSPLGGARTGVSVSSRVGDDMGIPPTPGPPDAPEEFPRDQGMPAT